MRQRLLMLALAAAAVLLGSLWLRSSAALKAAHEVHTTLTRNVLIGAYQNLDGIESLPPEEALQRLIGFDGSLAQAEILSLAHEKAGGGALLEPGATFGARGIVKNTRENLVRNGALGEGDLQFLKQAKSEIDLLLNRSLR